MDEKRRAEAWRFTNLPPEERQHELRLVLFQARMSTWARLSADQAQTLIDLCAAGCARVPYTTQQHLHDLLERVEAMAQRGDTFDQMVDWCEGLPAEVTACLYAELLKGGQYPGGPGRVHTRPEAPRPDPSEPE